MTTETDRSPYYLPYCLPRSEVHPLEIAGERLELLVALPDESALKPARGYPALVVLDGERDFATTAQLVRYGHRLGRSLVVLGLGYPVGNSRRHIDYTPNATRDNPEGGGADAFLAALAEQIIPYAMEHVELDRQHVTLFGHSYGGLFVLHTLLSRPGLFWGHIASSPSLWYGASELKANLLSLSDDPIPQGWLRHTVGAEEQQLFGADWRLPPDKQTARLEHLQRRQMVKHSHDVAAHLKGVIDNYQFYSYPLFNHMMVHPCALSSGIEAMNAALHQKGDV